MISIIENIMGSYLICIKNEHNVLNYDIHLYEDEIKALRLFNLKLRPRP